MDFIHGPRGSSDRDYSNSSFVRYSISSNLYRSSSFAPETKATVRRPATSPVNFKIATPSPPCLSTSSSPLPEPQLPELSTPPSHYRPPSPPPSSLEIKHGQSLVPPSAASIFHHLSHHLRTHRSARHCDYHPIRITNVSRANFEAFLDAHSFNDLLKGVDLEYDSLSGQIIMCPPPAPYHDCTPVFLQSVLVGLRNTPFDTPARQRTLSVREIRFRSPSGSYMVPDAAVVVLSEEGDIRIWPTIVVEVANSQGYDNVLEKVERWFVQSEGMVEVVLVLKFTAKDPLLDPACYVETWRYREVVDKGASDGDNDSRMDLDRDSDGEGLMERSDDVNLDINSATSPESNQQTTPSEHIEPRVDSINITAPVDQDSDSSLSSLDDNVDDDGDDDDDADDEAVTTVHDEDQQSASTASSTSSPLSPSSDSTGEYDPHPSHEIYLAGARKTVLPVADPADPQMRYLALCYSDFFGSENVPAGRDPDEEVLLDLDELRLEIRMLIRLTAKQEEPAVRRQVEPIGKRQAGAGGVVAEKRSKRVRR